MMRVRNLGRKSLKEVIQKLHEIGLELRHSFDGDYLDDEDEEDIEHDDAILEVDENYEDSEKETFGSMILDMDEEEDK